MEIKQFFQLITAQKYDEVKAALKEYPEYLHFENDYQRQILSYVLDDFEMTRYLVALGADLNHIGRWSDPLICQAAANRAWDIVDLLLDHGADPDLIGGKGGLIKRVLSVYRGDQERDRAILERVINASKTISVDHLRPLLGRRLFNFFFKIAAKEGVEPAVITGSFNGINNLDDAMSVIDRLLKEKLIDINDVDEKGDNLLMILVRNIAFNEDHIHYLADKKIDFKQNQSGLYAISHMVARGKLDEVKLLQKLGVDLSLSTQYSPLISEAERPVRQKEKTVPEMLTYLVAQGVDLTAENRYGRMAPHLLKKYNRTPSIKYLFPETVAALLKQKNEANNREIFQKLCSLQELAGDKKGKEILVAALVQFPDLAGELTKQLNHKQSVLREIAVKTLIALDDGQYLKQLEQSARTEGNQNIQKLLQSYLKNRGDQSKEREGLNLNLSWLRFDQLPEIRWERGEMITEEITFDLITLLRGDPESDFGIISEENYTKLLNLVAKLNRNDLMRLFDTLQQISGRFKSEHRWIFNIILALAEYDPSYLTVIDHQIELSLVRKQWVYAGKIIEMMTRMRNSAGVKKVEWYSRKMRHKGVKKSAITALVHRAKALNITLEELLITIVDDFGLGQNREIKLDYGSRIITAKLISGFKLVFINEKGKVLKSLPKLNQNDDPEKVVAVVKLMKTMKCELKKVVQKERNALEAMMVYHARRDVQSWRALFIDHPVLNLLTPGLFWGIYRDKTLKKVFRYSEDGSFVDLNSDEIVLNEVDQIGLINSDELSEKQLQMAKEVLEDFEIVQPILQIDR